MSKPFDESEVDAPVTPEEQAQAEALAQALEGQGVGPDPEFEIAALLRQARGAETPDVRAQVLPTLAARRPRRWPWLVAGLAVPATAVVLMIATTTMRMESSAPRGVPASATPAGVMARGAVGARVPERPAPPPTAAVLQVQAKAARGDRQALAALESEMRGYRSDFYRLVGAAILLAGHAHVDELLDGGNREGALRELRELWTTLRNIRAEGSVGGRQAMQDIAFRLARLSLSQKDLSGALAFCEAGLSLGKGDDLFTANLFVMRGIIRQELGQSAAAVEDLHQAILINEKLLKQALEP
jgi:hypothetical protein